MANLNNKVSEFRHQFNITKSFKDDQVFKLDPKGNLIAVWNNEDYYLTNKRNPTRFLSVSTMQHKLKYGVIVLRDLKLIEPKAKAEPKPKPKPEPLTLKEQLEDFKKFHKIPEDATLQADFKVVDDKLSVKWRGKWVPLYGNKKALANSTLQTKYGAKFLKDLSIPTVKQKPAELVQLPFDQFKYDKDFKNSLNEFFLDSSDDRSKLTTELEELKTPIGNYLRSYQMIIPSRIKDPILLFKEVKSTFEKTLESNLDSLGSLKYSIGLELAFKKEPDSFTDPPVSFYTKNEAVFNRDEINLDKQFLQLGERIKTLFQMAQVGNLVL